MLHDSLITEEVCSVDLFDTEHELSIMIFEEGIHELTLQNQDGTLHFQKSGNGKECYRFVKSEFKGEVTIKAITSSYVLIKKVDVGT